MRIKYLNKKNALFLSCLLGSTFSLLASETEPFELKYEFSSVISGQGGRIDPTPPPQHSSLSLSAFIAVSEMASSTFSEHSSTKAQFSFSGWATLPDLDWTSIDYQQALSVIDKHQYYEFSIQPHQNIGVHLSSIEYKLGRTSTGPRLFAVSSSFDNHRELLPVSYSGTSEFVTVLNDQIFLWSDESTSLSNHLVNIDLDTDEPISIRFYAWAAEDEKGKFSIDNVMISGYAYVKDSVLNENVPDTLDLGHVMTPLHVWRDSSYVEFSLSSQHYQHEILMPRPYVDAVVYLYNPHDSTALHVKSPSINILDALGNDVSDQFQLYCQTTSLIQPNTEGSMLMTMMPEKIIYEQDSVNYSVQGNFESYYFEDEVITNVLYPQYFTLKPIAFPKMAYIFPNDSGQMYIRSYNDQMAETLAFIWKNNTIDNSSTDSLYVKSLQHNEFQEWEMKTNAADSLMFENIQLASYAPEIAFYRLIEDCEQHHLVDTWNDTQDDYCRIFMADGRVNDVYRADSVLLYEWLNDTTLNIVYEVNPNVWTLASLPFDVHLDSLRLNQWLRVDGSAVSQEYYWESDRSLYLLDTLTQQDSVVYQMQFSWIKVPLVTIYTQLYDSICLGDVYQANGFDLPAFFEPGDFVFVDSLLAVSGADSIVSLYLNVCDKPAMPEQIIGDSIIVRAGTYVYTIKPVPNAAFYLWSVLPDTWIADSQLNTMSLTIPYTGKGEISVRAVNRCGQSDAASMNIQANLLSDMPSVASVNVYSDVDSQAFNLYVKDLYGKTTIVVYDMSGKRLYQESRMLQGEEEIFHVSLEEYASSMYMITIINEHYQSSTMLMK